MVSPKLELELFAYYWIKWTDWRFSWQFSCSIRFSNRLLAKTWLWSLKTTSGLLDLTISNLFLTKLTQLFWHLKHTWHFALSGPIFEHKAFGRDRHRFGQVPAHGKFVLSFFHWYLEKNKTKSTKNELKCSNRWETALFEAVWFVTCNCRPMKSTLNSYKTRLAKKPCKEAPNKHETWNKLMWSNLNK